MRWSTPPPRTVGGKAQPYPSAPSRSLIDATDAGFLMQFVVAANLAAMKPYRCSPGRRNADATGCPCLPRRRGRCRRAANLPVWHSEKTRRRMRWKTHRNAPLAAKHNHAVRAQSIADRRYGRYVAAAASAAMQPSPCASVADAATATGLRFCFQV